MRRTGIEAICFDLDDTLYPYAAYARTGLAAAADHLQAVTGESLHDELFALYFDEGVTTGTFDTLLARHGLDPALAADLVDAYHAATEPLDPYPETPAVLAALGRTYALGLVTDGRGGHGKLDRLGLTPVFDAVVVSPTFGSSKHEHEPFERVLDGLGVAPERVVYVGDDPRVDFRVPNDLGMATVRMRRGRYVDLEPDDSAAAPDAEIRRLDALLGLLRRHHSPVTG
ncbi:HAD family hydrolase [Halorarius litoreus]|uniref:HAD family hydrolase n=1 Tax=Halorarius litoreus TaxID=2962676 RepID=UPI0020CBE44A|nr:HAD family hydrolase [Halorarius litoreus]